jgi:iron(III) transport system permease protein
LVAAALWVFVLAAGDITITDMYQVRTFAEEVYTGFAMGDRLQEASARNLSALWLIGGAMLASLMATQQVVRNLQVASLRREDTNLTPSSRWATFAVYGLFVGWVALPIGSLCFQAGLDVAMVGSERERFWSVAKCVRLIVISPYAFRHELAWSFVLGQLCALTVVIASLTAAWFGRTRRTVRGIAWAVAVVSLGVPAPVLALAVAAIINQPGIPGFIYLYDRTIFVPWLVLSLRLFPFSLLLSEVLMGRISPRPWEIVRLSGAGPWTCFRHGIWPQLSIPLGALWLLILALALGDLSATILAVPPGITTVSIRIFNLVHYGVADQLAGLCLSTLAVFLLLVASLRVLLGTAPHFSASDMVPQDSD